MYERTKTAIRLWDHATAETDWPPEKIGWLLFEQLAGRTLPDNLEIKCLEALMLSMDAIEEGVDIDSKVFEVMLKVFNMSEPAGVGEGAESSKADETNRPRPIALPAMTEDGPDLIDALFIKPFEVVQLWASNEFSVHARQPRKLRAELIPDCPSEGEWRYRIGTGDDPVPFVHEQLPAFMPTRHNIWVLNYGSKNASEIYYELRATRGKAQARDAFKRFERSNEPVSRNLRDKKYQQQFWELLDRDWGISLPDPKKLGKADIVLTYRDGLPCAPAMERAVMPVIEALHGPVKQVLQALQKVGDKTYDIVEFKTGDGPLKLRYDITDLFGRNLDYEQFNFEKAHNTSHPDTTHSKKWWKLWK